MDAAQEQVARIVTAYGVRAAPVEVAQFTEVATRLALEDCFSILPPGAPAPEHVAHYTSLRVIQAETKLRDLLVTRIPHRGPPHPDVREHAWAVGWQLDAGEVRAAAAVASTDPLVIVEGAAGAGKTTMLAVAIAASKSAGRGARVVAPTKKAAEVAHAELGVPAESVAALVFAHGFRWNADGVWTRLAKADRDPDTGRTYHGPPRAARLGREERVIVDEAGMLDQDTALALLTVCAEAGATVALVGDRAQLPAVGRGGMLDMAANVRGATFDMAEVHRFTDPAYAALTVHMRDGHDPATVFDRLHELGLIQLHQSHEEAREDVAVSVRAGDALTVSTNDEARALNDRIRDERVRQGVVDDTATTTGSDGLAIGPGDLVQTRQNDSVIGVANRQTWIVQHVESGMLWVREARNDRKHQRTVVLPAEYVAAHTHLAYATTAYGVQGSTVTGSHTILTDATSAAAVYVGMTRGRERNQLHVVAESLTDARAQFLAAMERDRADRGLEHAALAAQDAVRGLVEDGPARLVNTEITALTERAKRAEWAAATWEQIATRFERQGAAHRDETAASEVAVQEADAQAERVRAEVVAPLVVHAAQDGTIYLARRSELWEASAVHDRAGRFKRRSAQRTVNDARTLADSAETTARQRWGSVPQTEGSVTAWAQQVAEQHAMAHPRVMAAARAAAAARATRADVRARHERERLGLLSQIFGAEHMRADGARYELTDPHNEAAKWQHTMGRLQRELRQLRGLSLDDAVVWV
ncbi:AAA family ATPase [Georgenia yuyongxinii]